MGDMVSEIPTSNPDSSRPVPPPRTAPDSGASADRSEVLSLLIETGALAAERLRHAERIHAKLDSATSLLTVVRRLGLVDEETLRHALRARPGRIRISELLSELGIVKPEDVRVALSMQAKPDEKRHLSARRER